MARTFEIAFQVAGKLNDSFKSMTSTAQQRVQKIQGHIQNLGKGKQRLEKFQQLKKQLDETQREYRESQDEVKRLAQQMQQTERPTRKMQEEFEKAKRKSAQLKQSVNKQGQELQELRNEMHQAGQSTRNLAEQQSDLSRQIQKAQKRAEGWSRVMNSNLSGSAQSVGENFKNLSRNAGIAATAVGVSAGYMVQSYASTTAETQKWAQRLGMATRELSKLQGVGKKYGVKQDALVDGLKELSMRTDEFAKTGKGPAAEAFQRLNLGQDELRAKSDDTAALFDLVSSKLSKVENAAKRQRLVDEIFGGQGGEQLVRMASASSEELEKVKQKVESVGGDVGEREGQQAREYLQTLRNVGMALQGVKRTMVSAILPEITKSLKNITQYIANNQQQVEKFAQAFSEKFKAALPKILNFGRGIGTVTGKLLKMTDKVANLIGGYDKLAMVIAAAFSAKLIASTASMAGSLFSMGKGLAQVLSTTKLATGVTKAWTAAQWALNVALNANPIGLIVAGVAALGTATYFLITKWDKVKAFFSGAMDWMGNPIQKAKNYITSINWGNVGQKILSGLKFAFMNFSPLGWIIKGVQKVQSWLGNFSLKNAGKALINTFVSGVKSISGQLYKAIKNSLGAVGKLLPGSDAKEGPLSQLTKAGQAIPTTLGQGFKKGAPHLKKTAQGALAGTAAAMTMAAPATGNMTIQNQQAQARITPVMDRAPQLQEQRTRARIIPQMDKVPQVQNQQAQARITPVMDRAPNMDQQQKVQTVSPPQSKQAAGSQTGVKQPITINNYITIEGDTQEPETQIRQAGDEVARKSEEGVRRFFEEGMRLSYS